MREKLSFILIVICLFISCSNRQSSEKKLSKKDTLIQKVILDTFNTTPIVSYKTSPEKIDFFLKDIKGSYFNNHGNLVKYLKSQGRELKFAMNGGMYLKDASPQGLYIEKGKLIKKINLNKSSYGNFYLQPNGVFYINKDNSANVATTSEFKQTAKIKYATQSGPMLLIKGKMHSAFTKGSKHLYIRNGVGILKNGDLLFAMSKDSINFYDFASYFEEQGCKNALYLDGAISKTYLPEKGIKQVKGRFGVIIAEIK